MTKKLIIHIGTGKTGTTALQKFFASNLDYLKRSNLNYLGLNLEYSPNNNIFEWQKPNGISILRRLEITTAKQQLAKVLLSSIQGSDQDETFIWINESIYEMPDVFLPVIDAVKASMQINIYVCAYVRSQTSYLLSAYRQWGVKHKTYSGKVKSFQQWVSDNKEFLSYGSKLQQWSKSLGEIFHIYNYHSAGNVVDHFIENVVMVKEELPIKLLNNESNQAPSDIELAIYALYNNTIESPCTPETVQGFLDRLSVESFDSIELLSSLFPTKDVMVTALEWLQHDKEVINHLLIENHENPIDTSSVPLMSNPSNTTLINGILSVLVRAIVSQESQIRRLESLISSRPSS